MEVRLAEYAGVCYGVAKALKTVNEMIERRSADEKIYTYGPLIHNKEVVSRLEKHGVSVLNDLDGDVDGTVVIRAHGVPPEAYRRLDERGIKYVDCTCRDVTKTHRIAEDCARNGQRVIIAGSPKHPEVVGTAGFAGGDVIIVEDESDLDGIQFDLEAEYGLMVQTTFSKEKFDIISEKLQNMNLKVTVYDTICSATAKRQDAARELSSQMDYMIVIGDTQSSNTTKLYEICRNNCKNSFLIETIAELELNIFTNDDRIGITAGASTPPDIIKEAYIKMSDLVLDNTNSNNQSFEEMLDDSLVTLYTGNVVKGTVINVSNGEVFVNLGYKSDGIIPKGEFSEDPSVDPASSTKAGDEIEVFVVRVNDGDGNVLLSKKKVDSQRNYDDLEIAFNDGQPILGKVIDIVKGGLIALINGVRVFVPSSQISNRYVEDLTQFKGKEFNFNIIEFDKSKRRFVAGRKALAGQEQKEKKEKVFASLEAGARIDGVVSRIVDFGAFVDLGGVDGLIHISELSWGRVKRVKDVLTEGDHVTVTVLELDKEKGKISLSLKDINNDPWRSVVEKYPIGQVISGKVVRMVPFGAFIELEEGVDGLIHISQISTKHVVKPEDELRIGQMVYVKVTDIDMESKRISLSKKEVDKLEEDEDENGAEAASELAVDEAEGSVEAAEPDSADKTEE